MKVGEQTDLRVKRSLRSPAKLCSLQTPLGRFRHQTSKFRLVQAPGQRRRRLCRSFSFVCAFVLQVLFLDRKRFCTHTLQDKSKPDAAGPARKLFRMTTWILFNLKLKPSRKNTNQFQLMCPFTRCSILVASIHLHLIFLALPLILPYLHLLFLCLPFFLFAFVFFLSCPWREFSKFALYFCSPFIFLLFFVFCLDFR